MYKFFKDFTQKISNYQVWRLISRIKSALKEDPQEVKEAKLNEIRALQKINWNVEIQQCELVERALCELVGIFETTKMTDGEKQFIKTTAMTVEETLHRKLKIEDIVAKHS